MVTHVKHLLSALSSEDLMIVMEDMMKDTIDLSHYCSNQEKLRSCPSMKTLSRLAFQTTEFSNTSPVVLQTLPDHLIEWCKPDFTIRLINDDRQYRVHTFILYGRWRYFQLLIDSGLKEAQNHETTLGEEWTTSRFQKWMIYIYSNQITFDRHDDVIWLVNYAGLYKMIDLTTTNGCSTMNDYPLFFFSDPYEEFELIHDYCISVIEERVDTDNIIEKYELFEQLGLSSRLQQAQNYIEQNFKPMMKNKVTREFIKAKIDPSMIAHWIFKKYET